MRVSRDLHITLGTKAQRGKNGEEERAGHWKGRQHRGEEKLTGWYACVCGQLTKTSEEKEARRKLMALTQAWCGIGSRLLMNPACQLEESLSLPQGRRGNSSQRPGLVWGPQSLYGTSSVTI